MWDKNNLPSRTSTSSFLTLTDEDSLQPEPCLPACVRTSAPAYNSCIWMHVLVPPAHPAVRREWWLLLRWVLRLHHAAALLPRSMPISPVLPRMGHPFSAPKSPISARAPPPGSSVRTSGVLDGLTFSQSMCSTAYWFFFLSPPALSLLYPVALCQIVSLTKKKKSSTDIIYSTGPSLLVLCFHCCIVKLWMFSQCITPPALCNTRHILLYIVFFCF